MEQFLNRAERHRLIRNHKSERDGRIRDRIKAVLLHDQGYSYTEIAKILLVDDETIRRHVADYEREEKLHCANGGSESHLTDKQTEELIAHLEEKTYLQVNEIVLYVKEKYKVTYTQSGMTKWLKLHKFRYKKPHRIPGRVDLEKQAAFIKKYKRIKKECEKTGDVIYFKDCVHPQHQTEPAYGWIRQGESKGIKMTACQRRLNFIGAININTHKVITEQVHDKTINHTHIEGFLIKLRSYHPPDCRIHLFLDGAGYNKQPDVYALAKKLNIKLHRLPPYSPNLNPIERLWKLMHENVRYNRYYEKFSEFTEATLEFFKTISRKKTILRKRITDNFQTFDDLNFAS
jgi:transposase